MGLRILSFSLVVLFLLTTAFLHPPASYAQTVPPLSAKHKKWLEEEVVYIISDWEKELLLSLPSEVARDKFIEEFWRIRDPNPATPENEFKEEHYRRIEYANQYFGWDAGIEGWRTDRGRIYIQLGEPQQRIQYRWLGEIRPVELWFYSQNIHPSLPNSFNILFFQPDAGSPYRLYSPYLDRPDKLITKIGHENDPVGSYRFLQRFNPELARASITLLTDEPVNPGDPAPSLASDSLLTRIRNLPNDKFTREMLERRRQLSELIETRIIYSSSEMAVSTFPLTDARGETFLHFLLQLPEPLKDMVGSGNKGQKYTRVTVNVLVKSPEGETIFQQTHRNRYLFKEEDFAWQQEWSVVYEDLLPLPPGEYEIDFVVRNELTKALYQAHQRVEVPARPAGGLWISPLVAYDEVYRADAPSRPNAFQFSDYKFLLSIEPRFGTSDKLRVFFQIADATAGPNSAPGEVLRVEYMLGTLARGGYRETATEEVLKQEFTSHGIVLHGKSFPLSKFPPGSYRLVVTVTDPNTRRRASQSLSFQVVPGSLRSKHVRLRNFKFEEDWQSGQVHYRRALGELARHNADLAIQDLQEALARGPQLHPARNLLVKLYYEREEYQQVVSLFPEEELTGDTDLETLQRFIASFEKTGQLDKAVQVAERALALWGPQVVLYENLAHLLDQTGQHERAEEIRLQIQAGRNTSPRE